ncbi:MULTISPECIES: Rpn family recombination-promoting nuclease/putative transposase [unclassified Moorena]|uniref:Rpn family recombination-promoting nuclease/putative transposase n=1 Tax=unclassified Moorena TaxID=2683338 RepID=UPI001400420B|nr:MULTISPECIES: Rpn family recombination-promoting nuclease/putative transposase [unclassified Moorena]NEO17483.1 Rpn family recombination-promoting nuclease/putative transposase [Moorena sp. SIO3E8]NEO42769.1 Rpn family recombination-promoting nuclease/putative transposase [Moorena sp. SIO4A3]NEQ04068.1 Rpn family recombination-promoting nuclease/putative transposase [Moorena sp. SIO3F7]
MAKPVDIGSKRLISLAPNAWVQWVTGNPQVRASQLLDAEFQWISRESDVIVKAKSPEHSEFLILNELQLRYDQNMPQRMRNYVALAEEKYNLSAYPVLINILPPPSTVTIVDCYDREFMGLKARQDYRVINLWEVDAELVLEQPLPPLFPFVPILFGGGSESKLRSAVQALRADQTLNQLEPLLAFFASFVLEIPLIQQIMRWDMTVLRESPWYQEILQEGVAQGIEQGLEQGLEQGIQQERRGSLERILKLRFSEIPVEISVRIQALNLEQLEELMATALTVNSLDEFSQHLPN